MIPAAARAQAMGKVTLDPAAEPAKVAPAPISPPIAASMPAPALPSGPAADEVIKPTVVAASQPAAIPDPILTPKKVEDALKTVQVLPEVKLPTPPDVTTPATKPVLAAATAPTAATSKPSIENAPIRSAASVAAESAAKPASAPSSGFGGLAQVVTALAVVIGLIFIGKAMARKFVPGAKAGPAKGVIEILARHPLAKNQSIVLVRIGSQIVALNQGRESSESVLVINDAAEVARIIGQIEGKSPDSVSAGFNRLLANARMDLETTSDEPELQGNENLDEQLEEMAAAKRQLMELRQHVRTVRDRLPRE